MAVNERAERIKTLLNILEIKNEPVSGEKLAAAIGVSRVAVWKLISALKEKGYNIESAHSGYRLLAHTDKPVPWELDSSSGPVEYHDELDSTMKKAALLLEAGCENGTTVIAGSQSGGLNATGGEWSSPDGGLYLTRIRTAPFPACFAGLYTVSCAGAAVKLLREAFGVDAEITWPGGIVCSGRRVGGVLTEFRGSNGTAASVSAGIGLNLNNTDSLPEGAAALCELTGAPVSIKAVTAGLLEGLEAADGCFPGCGFARQYEKLIAEIGKKSVLLRTGESGIITGLDNSGALLFETGDGRIEYIFSGDEIKYE